MNRLLASAILMSIVLAASTTASAEVLKGRVKAIDSGAKLFSLMTVRDKVILVSWD
ncbi:MAG: hypothetical protein HXX17_04295, partial [Geobacteraceae bacterium]|nr:hypothetical protein [Geobacteraceae bacterium]